MTDNEMLDQLKSVIDDRKYFLTNDSELNEVFIKDIVALELIISKYKELKLNDTVEILEEEKKIPEKIEYYDDSIAWVIDDVGQLSYVDKVIIDKLNEVLDYLKSKGE